MTKEKEKKLFELFKKSLPILASDIAFSVARYGYNCPSSFDWEKDEASPYEFYKAILEIRKMYLTQKPGTKTAQPEEEEVKDDTEGV